MGSNKLIEVLDPYTLGVDMGTRAVEQNPDLDARAVLGIELGLYFGRHTKTPDQIAKMDGLDDETLVGILDGCFAAVAKLRRTSSDSGPQILLEQANTHEREEPS